MASCPEFEDVISITRMCYGRFCDLLEEVPEDQLDARVGTKGLTVREQVGHAFGAELFILNLIDGGSRPVPELPAKKAELLEHIRRIETEFVSTLDRLPAALLREQRKAPFRPQEDTVLGLLILITAHKYYHTGQLQSILHALGAEA